MHVDDAGITDLLERTGGQLALHRRKWIIERVHHDPAHDIHHQDLLTVRRGEQPGPFAGRAGREIRRPQQRRFTLDKYQRFSLVPGMIAKGDNIGAGIAQRPVNLFGNPETAGRVLTVHDNKISLQTIAQIGKRADIGSPPGLPNDVAEERQPHSD